MQAKLRVSDRRVGIVGLGLIGGSLALALRERKGAPEAWGCDPDRANLRKALAAGAIARAVPLAELAGECDVVVVCVPVTAALEVICEAACGMRPGSVLTDTGSVKSGAVEVGRLAVPDGVEFVGGHPIAGTERSGFSSADGKLFSGRTFIVTPHGGNTEKGMGRVERLWKLAGARTVRMEPSVHDRVFAWVSHLPHAVAYSLVHAVATLPEPVPLGSSAGGFRDFTRIASSSPRMWADIFLQNRKELLPALKGMREDLSRLEKAVRTGDEDFLLEFLGRAKAARDGI
jgi:prephenate dehydrogenase